MADDKRYTVVDLFCGCGGLSRGLERTGRFWTCFGVDIHRPCIETFNLNHGTADRRPVGHLGDIREVRPEEVWAALAPYGIKAAGELDCLVGGPPCEGFSRNTVYTKRIDTGPDPAGVTRVAPVTYKGEKYWQVAWQTTPLGGGATREVEKVVRAYNPFLNDPRNFLFRAFLDQAAFLQPKLIVIENVQQMLTHDDGAIAAEIIDSLSAMGYNSEARVLNAAEFGVPQLRRRAFFLAVRRDLEQKMGSLPWPTITHGERALASLSPERCRADHLLPGDQGAFVTVEEAIKDLPEARSVGEGNPPAPASAYPFAHLSDFRRFVRSQETTPANHVYRTPGEQVINRLRAMRPGMKTHELPQDLQTKKYYYNAYGRLEWGKPANTITKSFIYPGSGKFGHPEDDRIISYREAARLQSFDDDFTFYAKSQEGISHMIGSAVPPLLGYRFGEAIAHALDKLKHAESRNISDRHRLRVVPRRG